MSNIKDKVELLSKLKKHTPIAKGLHSWVATLPSEMVGSVPSVGKYLGRALNIGARMNPYIAVGLGIADANKAMFGDESPFSGNYWIKPFSNGEIVPTFRGYPYQIDYETYSNPLEALAHAAYGTVNLPTVEVRPTMNAEEANPAKTENNSSTESGASAGSSSATSNPDDNKENGDKKPSVVEKAKETAENISKGIKEAPKKAINGVRNWAGRHKKALIGTGLTWQAAPLLYGTYLDNKLKAADYQYLKNGWDSTPAGLGINLGKAVLNLAVGYNPSDTISSKDKQNSNSSESKTTFNQGNV